MKCRLAPFVLTATLAVWAATPAARATVADLEAAQRTNANLIFQYGFEGADDASRLADGSSNGYTLQTRTSGGSSAGDIMYVPGWGGVGQAYEPLYTTSRVMGAGLNTVATNIPVVADSTVEAVFQLDAYVDQADADFGSYVLSARPSEPPNGRAYFIRQWDDNGSGTGRITSTFGDTFGDTPAVLTYNPGDWYYFVVVAEYDSGSNTTTANWYAANLTAGDETLGLLATDSSTFTGSYLGTSQFGIGNFLNGTQEYMDGRIDSIAYTGAALSASELQARLDALNTPGAALPGDFDMDNDVDGEDFLVWQRNPAVGDLADWEENFGTGTPAVAGASAVPEPSAIALASLLGVVGFVRRFTRRSQVA